MPETGQELRLWERSTVLLTQSSVTPDAPPHWDLSDRAPAALTASRPAAPRHAPQYGDSSAPGEQPGAGANPSPTLPLLAAPVPPPPTPHQSRRRGREGSRPRPPRRSWLRPAPSDPYSLVTARGVAPGRTTADLSPAPGCATRPPAGGGWKWRHRGCPLRAHAAAAGLAAPAPVHSPFPPVSRWFRPVRPIATAAALGEDGGSGLGAAAGSVIVPRSFFSPRRACLTRRRRRARTASSSSWCWGTAPQGRSVPRPPPHLPSPPPPPPRPPSGPPLLEPLSGRSSASAPHSAAKRSVRFRYRSSPGVARQWAGVRGCNLLLLSFNKQSGLELLFRLPGNCA